MILQKGENVIVNKFYDVLVKENKLDLTYKELYSEINHEKLESVLSSLHNELILTYEYMNRQLNARYYHADPSREAIDLFDKVKRVLSISKIRLIPYYAEIIKEIKTFIRNSGGTSVPDEFKEINIIEQEPVFIFENTITKVGKASLKLIPIGKGSYAEVYKYRDEDYDKDFVIKRLKNTAEKKDLERFKREFDVMKSLKSPYVVEVYKYDSGKNEYIMECMDQTIFDYINDKHKDMDIRDRFYIIQQILRVFSYLENKKILHRDISYKNILLKKYDHALVVKLSDFGLVKIEGSCLTDLESEWRGSLNDPGLRFREYEMIHETYALTNLFTFILSGRTNFAKIKDKKILDFYNKGVHTEIVRRYQNITELEEAIRNLRKALVI